MSREGKTRFDRRVAAIVGDVERALDEREGVASLHRKARDYGVEALPHVDPDAELLKTSTHDRFADMVVPVSRNADRYRGRDHERTVNVDEVVMRRGAEVLERTVKAVAGIHG